MIGRFLCWLGFHGMLHVDTLHVGHGEHRMEFHLECKRCGVPLDYKGDPIEKSKDSATRTR